jgi:hypothetical protein
MCQPEFAAEELDGHRRPYTALSEFLKSRPAREFSEDAAGNRTEADRQDATSLRGRRECLTARSAVTHARVKRSIPPAADVVASGGCAQRGTGDSQWSGQRWYREGKELAKPAFMYGSRLYEALSH